MSDYPNLELIEERFTELIKDEVTCYKDALRLVIDVYHAKTDPRTRIINGIHYVTVVHELYNNIYGVFVGNEFRYKVKDPNDIFFVDFAAKALKEYASEAWIYGFIPDKKEKPTMSKKIIPPHWYINPDGYHPQCSVCHREPKNGQMADTCPNCGAKMDLNYKSI